MAARMSDPVAEARAASRRLIVQHNLDEQGGSMLFEFMMSCMADQLSAMFSLSLKTQTTLAAQQREIDGLTSALADVAVKLAENFKLSDRQKRSLREAVSHFLAHPLLGHTGRFLLSRLDCLSSVTDRAMSLPQFTINTVEDLVVGDKETAKHSDLIQGHFAHRAGEDTWSRERILEDLSEFPPPTPALFELSNFQLPLVAPAVIPHPPAPAPVGPPGPLANAMAALPPLQITPEAFSAEEDEEVDDAPYQ
ncbi:unnamed protein product [Peniophora sp. CBMAI 1063]|nr:unnamed protein product [Peniophora sp. CBMAI 1063]